MNDSTVVGQCCYANNGTLITGITGGRDWKADPSSNYFEHFAKDNWPIIVCCEDLGFPIDENCMKVLNEQQVYFALSFARGYAPPEPGKHALHIYLYIPTHLLMTMSKLLIADNS